MSSDLIWGIFIGALGIIGAGILNELISVPVAERTRQMMQSFQDKLIHWRISRSKAQTQKYLTSVKEEFELLTRAMQSEQDLIIFIGYQLVRVLATIGVAILGVLIFSAPLFDSYISFAVAIIFMLLVDRRLRKIIHYVESLQDFQNYTDETTARITELEQQLLAF
jgi:Flp pilus assembly protein TadB